MHRRKCISVKRFLSCAILVHSFCISCRLRCRISRILRRTWVRWIRSTPRVRTSCSRRWTSRTSLRTPRRARRLLRQLSPALYSGNSFNALIIHSDRHIRSTPTSMESTITTPETWSPSTKHATEMSWRDRTAWSNPTAQSEPSTTPPTSTTASTPSSTEPPQLTLTIKRCQSEKLIVFPLSHLPCHLPNTQPPSNFLLRNLIRSFSYDKRKIRKLRRSTC